MARSVKESVTLSEHLVEHIKARHARSRAFLRGGGKNNTLLQKILSCNRLVGVYLEERFCCIGNIFAMRDGQLCTAEESAEAQKYRTEAQNSGEQKMAKSAEDCETISPFRSKGKEISVALG